MKHQIPVGQLGEAGRVMAGAVESCVHCGFCLPTCPTYQVLGQEMDSPRGRIVLMKEVLEGGLALESALPHVDRCLGCLGCVTACPSGVAYGDLVTSFRAWAEERRSRPGLSQLQRSLTEQTLPYPGRFRLAAMAGKIAKPLQQWLPEPMGNLLAMLPNSLPPAEPLPLIYPAIGPRRARVALLVGCVQQVLAPEINWATLRVLAANGVEVMIPAGQSCCGALAMHSGAANQARQLADHNLTCFPSDVEAIITNAAGCGSAIQEYGLLFAGQAQEEAARLFAGRTLDVSQFLADLGLRPPPPLPIAWQVAYHDACHLAHAQGVRSAPRILLGQIPNLTLLEIPDGEICCGSAGTYNLEQPEIAAELGRRKANNILQTNPDVVVMGNIGCLIQIGRYLSGRVPLYHTIQLLDLAYRNLL